MQSNRWKKFVREKGSGMGLPIAKRLFENMVEIFAYNNEVKGTTIVFQYQTKSLTN